MYPVSEDYWDAMQAPVKRRYIEGTVGPFDIDDRNILKGSLTITNKCSDGNDIKIGSVFIGELNVTIIGLVVGDDFGWYGQKITLTEYMDVDYAHDPGHNLEPIPLGEWYISSCEETASGFVITAYDAMAKLDKKFPYNTSMQGKMWNFFDLILSDLHLTTTEHARDFIEAQANGTQTFKLSDENDIETYRDLLFWIAQTICCFATVNRYGDIEFRRYGSSSDYRITQRERWKGAKFSTFVTKYTGIYVNDIEKNVANYYHVTPDDGLKYELGSNPFLQGKSSQIESAKYAIVNQLSTYQFSPFELSRSGCPAFDLGDSVALEDGLGGGRIGCVMSYSYNYHGEYKMVGYGRDPDSRNAKSHADKELAGMASRVNANEIQFYLFTNAAPISISSTKNVIDIRFTTKKTTYVVFQAEILLEIDAASRVKVTYKMDNVAITDYVPTEDMEGGKRILSLYYPMMIEEANVHRWQVQIETDADISIPARNCRATIWGQGLAASDSWDGWITAEDNIETVTFAAEPNTVDALMDDAGLELIPMIVIEASEEIGDITFKNEPTVEEFFDAVYINKKPISTLTWAEAEEYTWAELEDEYLW